MDGSVDPLEGDPPLVARDGKLTAIAAHGWGKELLLLALGVEEPEVAGLVQAVRPRSTTRRPSGKNAAPSTRVSPDSPRGLV